MMTVKSRSLSANPQSKIRRTNLCLCALAAIALLLVACDVELRKTDAQLGLNPQQAAGRHIFDEHCERCHSAYVERGTPKLELSFRNHRKAWLPGRRRMREL